MHTTKDWHDCAEEARTRAAELRDAQARAAMLEIAESYDRLAEMYDRLALMSQRPSKAPG